MLTCWRVNILLILPFEWKTELKLLVHLLDYIRRRSRKFEKFGDFYQKMLTSTCWQLTRQYLSVHTPTDWLDENSIEIDVSQIDRLVKDISLPSSGDALSFRHNMHVMWLNPLQSSEPTIPKPDLSHPVSHSCDSSRTLPTFSNSPQNDIRDRNTQNTVEIRIIQKQKCKKVLQVLPNFQKSIRTYTTLSTRGILWGIRLHQWKDIKTTQTV